MSCRAAFLPPLMSPPVLSLGKAALPLLFRWQAGGIEVTIPEADLATLRGLKGKRVLLLPNHPTHFDPMVMLEVSNRVDEDFNFVAAREVFDQSRAWGWLLHHLGCYSLVRGAVDRESFATTQRILAEGKNWLVIFIEREVSLENDSVIPFEAGVLSMALRTQDKLDARESPVRTVPVAMRTTYKAGIEHAIVASIRRLEEAVGIVSGYEFVNWEETRRRLAGVGRALLESVERTYLLTPKAGDSLDSRVNALKKRLLSKMEAYLDINPAAYSPILERVRIVRNRVDRIIHTYGDEPEKTSPYERQLLERRGHTFVEFYKDLGRLVNFLTFRGDYLEGASPERFAEVTIRLEKEILGHPVLVHPREVAVRVGNVRNLQESLPAFQEDKRKTCAAITESLEEEMKELLQGMKRR